MFNIKRRILVTLVMRGIVVEEIAECIGDSCGMFNDFEALFA